MIINIILFLVIAMILTYITKKILKECKSNIEIVLIILYIIIVLTPVIIYFLDICNIPSILFLTKNVDSQNWLSFLANYTSSIISAIIGAITSVYIVFYQIRKNNEDTEKRDKENLRIQNMPILKYFFDTNKNVPVKLENFLETNLDVLTSYQLTIGVKNIGLNSIKSLKAYLNIEQLGVSEQVLGKDTIEVLEKGEEVYIEKIFKLDCNNKSYEFELIVEYEDLLENWYRQKTNIKYIASNLYLNGSYTGFVRYSVEKECCL